MCGQQQPAEPPPSSTVSGKLAAEAGAGLGAGRGRILAAMIHAASYTPPLFGPNLLLGQAS